jgi:hypothetical protein
MKILAALARLFSRNKPKYPLEIRRYETSVLDPVFMNMLRFMRGSDDVMDFNLGMMPGFKWNDEVDAWMKARDCKYEVNLRLRPTISEQKNDVMTITFASEQDRLEFKLTFL